MEEQIITVHIPKDQYRKFAQIAWQVNVPMQTILSQFVADFTSDRWGTAEGTMAKIGSGIIGGAILNERIFGLVSSK